MENKTLSTFEKYQKKLNKQLYNFARNKLKEDLIFHCTEGQENVFKKMYGNDLACDGLFLGDYNDLDIKKVVDCMHYKKLDWAMQQVERAVIDNEKERLTDNLEYFGEDGYEELMFLTRI